MTTNNDIQIDVSLCDLFMLHDESSLQIDDLGIAYAEQKSGSAPALAKAYYEALDQNMRLGEAILEEMAKEAFECKTPGIVDLPFLKTSRAIQKEIAMVHDTMIFLERENSHLYESRRFNF